MDRLRNLAPWQIILMAVGVLIIVLVGGYFLITLLTTTKPAGAPETKVPADLGGATNEQTLQKLQVFEAPRDLPIVPEPVQTVDPNAPSTVNPFE